MVLLNSEFLIILLLVLTTHSYTKRTRKSRHNEIVTRADQKITLKFPEVITPIAFNRIVNPVEVDCKSPEFKKAIKDSKSKVKCKPRPTVIYLESTTKSTLVPSAVIVKRCGGACPGSEKCVPKKVHHIQHYVREIKNNFVKCSTVNVTEHLDCRCECIQKPKDCNDKQEFDRKNCKCGCKQVLKNNCLSTRRVNLYHFDEESCECKCTPLECTTGTVWSFENCRCIKAVKNYNG